MKIGNQEGEAIKISSTTTSANLLCTSSILGLYGKPGIHYQQYGPFFFIEVHYLFTVISTSMRCELGLTLEHCYNIVRNTLIRNI